MSFNQIGRYDEEFDDRWRETEKQRKMEKEKDNSDRGPIEERRVEFESRMTMMMMMACLTTRY